MPDLPAIPRAFSALGPGKNRSIPIIVREDLDPAESEEVVDLVDSVAWAELQHAYGPAADVGDQLIAATVGDDKTRQDAWWNLWGNVHHQGTVYEATVARLSGSCGGDLLSPTGR